MATASSCSERRCCSPTWSCWCLASSARRSAFFSSRSARRRRLRFLHVRLPGLLGRDEHEVVAQRPKGSALRALAGENALDQVGRLFDRRPHGHSVVGQYDELGAPVAYFVGNVEGPAGEGDRVEDRAFEDPADAVVQFGASLGTVDVLFLPPDDLAQVRFDQEAQRRGGPVVQIGGLGDELLASFLDEADVQYRSEHGVAQVVGGQALERFVERQRVHEDRPRRVLGVRRQTAVVGGVDLLGQRFPAGRAGDVVGDRWRVGVLDEAGEDLLANRLVARVDVVHVDRRRVRRLFLP